MVDEKRFELWFEFLDNPYQETADMGRSWGRFGFCLDGTQLFQRMTADQPGWEWNLIYLYDWLKGGFWEKDSLSLMDYPWQGAIKYYEDADEWFSNALNIEEEEKAVQMIKWISEKNLWNVGRTINAPSIYVVAIGDRVEISWEREENFKRRFNVPPSDRVAIDLRAFKSEVDKFLDAYEQVVLAVDEPPFFRDFPIDFRRIGLESSFRPILE